MKDISTPDARQDAECNEGHCVRVSVFSNRLLLFLSLIGLGIATYLTLAHLSYLALVCGAMDSGCDRVAQHSSSRGFGIPALKKIPTAAFGMAMFVAMTGLTFLRVLVNNWAWQRRLALLQWMLALAGVFVVSWLTYQEAFVIHAWCPWCVTTAFLVVGLFGVLTIQRCCTAHSRRRNVNFANPRGEVIRFFGVSLAALMCYVAILHNAPPPIPLPTIVPGINRSMFSLSEFRVSGNPNAPFMLVELGKYDCLDCRRSLEEVHGLLGKYQDRMSFVFIPSAHKPKPGEVPLLAMAAEAAARQGRYWEMHSELMEQQEQFINATPAETRERVLALAEKLEFDVEQFRRDLNDIQIRQLVIQRQQFADSLKPYGYPTFYFITPQGKTVRLYTTEQVKQWLEDPQHWQ